MLTVPLLDSILVPLNLGVEHAASAPPVVLEELGVGLAAATSFDAVGGLFVAIHETLPSVCDLSKLTRIASRLSEQLITKIT